jgi:hypothetical protein
MTLQYLRKVKVTFNGGALVINPSGRVELHELKVGFTVSKGLSGSPNTAELSIWNLAEGHRNAVGKELDEVQIEAGYMPPSGGGNVGILFKGQMRDVEHRREKADIITTISCGDGDKAMRRATTAKSFPAGTPVKDIVDHVAGQLEKEGISRGQWKLPENLPTLKRPYATCGAATREMDRLGRGHGFYWSCQNGALEIIPGDGDLGGAAILIAPHTGMIGSPAVTDNGVKVTALLNPAIAPNRRIRVESDIVDMGGANGEYRVSQVSFAGDNRDGRFVVDVHGEAIGAGGKVDEGKKA